MSFAYRVPQVSVDLDAPKSAIRRNQNSEARTERMQPGSSLLRLLGEMLDGDGERQSEGMAARYSCPWCGHRALEQTGHPRGEDGQPACVAAKARMRGIGW